MLTPPLLPPAGHELSRLHEEYVVLAHKNLQIERACDAVQARIDAVKGSSSQEGANGGQNGEGAHANGGRMDVDQ